MDARVEEERPRNTRAAVTRSRDRAGQTEVLYTFTVLSYLSSRLWFGHRVWGGWGSAISKDLLYVSRLLANLGSSWRLTG